MLRLLPLLLALLAACQVDVEGAPCRLGYPEDCPAGQGCGLDERCSTRCEKDDAPGCRCPPNDGPEFAADPAGSRALDVAPYPTGVESPVACRFGRLGDALAAAATYAAAHPEGGAVARAYGNTPVTFGFAETGEAFPLDIAPGVVLSTAAPAPDPANWIIRADTSSSSDVVTLHDGATIEGVTISSVSAAGDVVRLSCASRNKAELAHVVVDGGGVASRGVKVVGPCDLDATELAITRASATGLHVDVDLEGANPVTGVSVSGGAITGNGGNGVELSAGLLELSGTDAERFVVSDNAAHGLVVHPRSTTPIPAVAVAIDRADFTRNGEVGIFLKELPAGSSASIRSTDVHENQAQTPASAFYGARRAAGLILWGEVVPRPLTFAGNRVWANSGDQVGVLSGKDWKLSGEDCDQNANVFACPSASGYLVYSVGAVQTAGRAYWPVDSWPPTSLLHQTEYQTVDAGICPMDQTRLPECPTP
jgi:hypothetical protein